VTTIVLVTDDVVELSTVAVVVVAGEDTAEDVRELVEDAVVETNGVDEDDVSVFVEVAMELDVDVTSVDDAVVRDEDVVLVDVSEVSELSVLEEEARDDVEDTVSVARVVDATEDSVDVRDRLVEGVCDSSVVDATVPVVDPEDDSELVTDVRDETVIVELSIW
jgi:hypothetical protein